MVGLIKDGHLNSAEVNETLFHEVFETTGGGDDDIDTLLERRDLSILRNTTKYGHRSQSIRVRERLKRCGDLCREFTGRCENQAERIASAAFSASKFGAEARNHRDSERESLSRSGFASTENVSTCECVGQGVDLNGEGGFFAVFREDRDERGGHAERAEGVSSHSNTSFTW
ncbi:unannotated protein [freshwater metagenome]|uniref:Unannotated protein n=1 Tax=freshwater metagenome TaxID=449393 RepID=A0A6J7DF21_9ZZZZ